MSNQGTYIDAFEYDQLGGVIPQAIITADVDWRHTLPITSARDEVVTGFLNDGWQIITANVLNITGSRLVIELNFLAKNKTQSELNRIESAVYRHFAARGLILGISSKYAAEIPVVNKSNSNAVNNSQPVNKNDSNPNASNDMNLISGNTNFLGEIEGKVSSLGFNLTAGAIIFIAIILLRGRDY